MKLLLLYMVLELLICIQFNVCTDAESSQANEEVAPHFTKRMFKFIIKPTGNMANLNCKVSGTPMPNITWYKNGNKSLDTEDGDVKIKKWSLILEDLATSDAGNYTCVVCNVVNCINFTYSLEVIERYHSTPILLSGLENTTVLVGSNFTMTCKFLADFYPHITWTKIFNETYSSVLQKSDNGVLDPEVLQIVNVTHEDEGWYCCIAVVGSDSTVSKAYLEVVDEKPSTTPTFDNDDIKDSYLSRFLDFLLHST